MPLVEAAPEARAYWWRTLPMERAGALLRPQLSAAYGCWERSAGTAHAPDDWFRLLVAALQAETSTPQEAVALAGFALRDALGPPTRAAQAALNCEPAGRVLRRFADTVGAAALNTPATANAWLAELRLHFREGEGLRGRAVMEPLRAALTGDMVGPCLGNVTTLLGAQRCRRRVQAALALSTGQRRDRGTKRDES